MASSTKKQSLNTQVADEASDSLGVPASMKPEIMAFEITGISPLLQNNPAAFIGAVEEVALGAKKVYDDREEARMRTYWEDDGSFYHPMQSFIKAMLKAVAGKKFGKVFATKAVSGSVFLVSPHATILTRKGEPAQDYTIDRQPVVVGKARVLRCRPCWKEWFMKIAFEVDAAILGRPQVFEALSLAGRIIGIGDYRPEKGGGFGRFTVK